MSTTVSIEVPNELLVPAISACYRYTNILIYDRLNQRNGTEFTFNMTEEELDELYLKLTMHDIFEMTPDANQSIVEYSSKIPVIYS